MTIPTQITTHAADALATMLSQYDDSPRFRALLEILADQVQPLENVTYEVLTERLLDAAKGVQLDIYGIIVGGIARTRAGRTDDDYRKLILIAVRVNNTNATAEEAIQIVADLVETTVYYTQHNPAHYRLEWILGTPSEQQWLDGINAQMPRITASGVSWSLVEGPTGAFRFDSGPGFDQGKFARRVDNE